MIESQRPASLPPSSAQGFGEARREGQLSRAMARPKVNSIIEPLVFASSTEVTNANARTILGNNLNRRYLMIQNVGTTTVYLGFGVVPNVSGDNSVEVPSGYALFFDGGYVPVNDINAVSASENKISILEGNALG